VSFETLAARARGLGSRTLPDAGGSPTVVEDRLRDRAATELAILVRWGGPAVAPLELDEDRHTVRAIARGVVANIGPTARIAGAIPTRSLSLRRIGALANASSFGELRRLLHDHPLAHAFDATELFIVEHELARLYLEHARLRDRAFVVYRAQLVDIENAQAALVLATRGGDLDREALFLAGGARVTLATFLLACASPEAARETLSHAFAKTPLATALFAAGSSAIEDAALAWQIATQARLRRTDPLGLAAVLALVLRRRDEARRLRRAAWATLLGGVA
jgi:hypothetical protein